MFTTCFCRNCGWSETNEGGLRAASCPDCGKRSGLGHMKHDDIEDDQVTEYIASVRQVLEQ